MIQRFAIGIAVAAIAALCLAAIAADSSRTEKTPAAVDSSQFAEFMSNEAFGLPDLAEGAEIQRRFFDRITPQGVSLRQPMFPFVVPFDHVNFPDSFLKNLFGEDRNAVAVYPLSLALDPRTRETLVYNADGKLIATISADRDSFAWPEVADPARVTLQLDLLPSEDVEPYLYAESRIAESAGSKTAKSAKSGGVSKMSLETNEFGICDIRKLTDDSMRILVTNWTAEAELYAYTVAHTSSVVVAGWTNEYGVPANTNILWAPMSPPFDGIESGWECLSTNLLFTNRVAIWEDSGISGDARVRFYAAAKRVDSDGDGLTDGEEIFRRRTDPGLADTDEDGIPDGAEIGLGLDPLDDADAEEDPDGDHLVNREEYELNLPMNGSNEVTMVYFNPDPPPARRSPGDPANVLYLTRDNLRAKALSTIRFKEGYAEFTNTAVPPSDPPRWYLSSEATYQALDSGTNTYDNQVETHLYGNRRYCWKEFDPNGWPDAPSNHVCTGLIFEAHCRIDSLGCRRGFDYYCSYDQPSENLQLEVHNYTICGGSTLSYLTPWANFRTCFTMSPPQGILTHTEVYSSNSFFPSSWFWIDPGAHWIYAQTLTNEYTDEMLRRCTREDLGSMTDNWGDLAWGQRYARDDHRQEPYMEALPSNEVCSAYLISTNHDQLQLQDLHYQWIVPTTTGVHYKAMWLEAFRPQGGNTYTRYKLRSMVFDGDGNDYVSPVYTNDPPWNYTEYGTTEPIGFLVQLECNKAEKSPMGFGDGPPPPVCYAVWDEPAEAAKSDRNKIDSALTVLFKNASTPEGDPVDFDVTLRVIPDTLEGVYWSITAGSPDSGWLLNADQPVATFRNPTKGGLYKFETSIPGIPTITSQLWLPVSGPDISANFQSEIDYLRNWKPRYLTNLHTRILASLGWYRIENQDKYNQRSRKLKREDIIYLGPNYDYVLISQSLIQDVCGLANMWGDKGAAGDSIRLDISSSVHTYVTDFAKRNNMGYAMCARAQGRPPWQIILGPNLCGILGYNVGTSDDEHAVWSYWAGIDLMDGKTLSETMDKYGLKMQHPASRTAKEWPSDVAATTSYIVRSTNVIFELEKMAGENP